MNNIFMFNPFLPNLPVDYDIPPTIYAILNSYVNFDNPNPVKISNLASAGRGVIFDFDYPLTSNITKANFETMILNNFLMRRIGYETVTAFKIALNVKLNEIMPKYNKLFDSMKNWNLFNDGETISRREDTTLSNQENGTSTGSENNTISSNSSVSANASGSGSNISDRRYSDTPQNELSNVQDGKYVTNYNYDTDTSTTSNTSSSTETDSTTEGKTNSRTDSKTGSSTGAVIESITRTNADKNDLFIKFSQEVNNVYTLIFRELDPLFYGLL